jgi:hypothetical protein
MIVAEQQAAGIIATVVSGWRLAFSTQQSAKQKL